MLPRMGFHYLLFQSRNSRFYSNVLGVGTGGARLLNVSFLFVPFFYYYIKLFDRAV
jgi:hypothetical protein